MNKQVLSPFDCDMCAMIEDITKQEIEVTASDTSIRLSWRKMVATGTIHRVEMPRRNPRDKRRGKNKRKGGRHNEK